MSNHRPKALDVPPREQQHRPTVAPYPPKGYGAQLVSTVVLDKTVLKALTKLPQHVVDKLLSWVASVERYGLEEVRKVPGYHDEPLKGQRAGQRSVRLSRSYRAFYVIEQGAVRMKTVRVIDVNKHKY